ncbi:MAG TPA: hypothetical protein VFI19_08730 [Nocardioides sp.]|nr:hypothetical protein [Nocardioides sp.]
MRLVPTAGAAAIMAVATLTAGCGGSSSDQSAAPSSSTVATTDTSIAPSSQAPAPSSSPTSPSPTSGAGSPSEGHPTEFNPPGDIPDDAVFVDHTAPGTQVHFSVPEGWAATTQGPVTTYTDKYNSISIEVRPRATAPTVASARAEDVPELQQTAQNFQLQGIENVDRKHAPAVHLTYLSDSPPNPVTDKVVRDAAERFEFWKGGEEAILTLAGPQGADNVDPWQVVSDSLEWK